MQVSVISPTLLVVVLMLVAPRCALSDPLGQNDLDWLKTMAFAAHQTDYIGTFVYQYGNHVETSRITHISDRDGEHGRLEGLDGIRREIIQDNEQVWRYQGDRKVSVANRQGRRSFPALLPEQLSLLNENYRIKRAEDVRVAGFHTHAFIFQPKDNLRYSQKMWAHSDSGLLLKAAVLDERGRIVEQYTFTQLTIGGKIDRKWITRDKSAPGFHSHHPFASPLTKPDSDQTVPDSGWYVYSIPPGFKKTQEIRRPLRDNNVPVTQMVFSDGLAGISVFIEDITGNSETNVGLSSQGAIQIYSKISGDNLVTVVGEVPPRTVMRIADSVRYRGK